MFSDSNFYVCPFLILNLKVNIIKWNHIVWCTGHVTVSTYRNVEYNDDIYKLSVFWPAERLVPSQERLCLLELVIFVSGSMVISEHEFSKDTVNTNYKSNRIFSFSVP
jgi:hypothetical protein